MVPLLFSSFIFHYIFIMLLEKKSPQGSTGGESQPDSKPVRLVVSTLSCKKCRTSQSEAGPAARQPQPLRCPQRRRHLVRRARGGRSSTGCAKGRLLSAGRNPRALPGAEPVLRGAGTSGTTAARVGNRGRREQRVLQSRQAAGLRAGLRT